MPHDWRLARPAPFATFDTSVFHAYDSECLAACDPTKTVVESIAPLSNDSPRCQACMNVVFPATQ